MTVPGSRRWRLASLCLAFTGMFSLAAAWPQDEAAEGPSPDAALEEIRGLIKAIQGRIEAMDSVAQDRDKALGFLDRQVREASSTLSSGRDDISGLRQENVDLSARVETLISSRDELARRLDERDAEAERLAGALSSLEMELAVATAALQQAEDEMWRMRNLASRLDSEAALAAGEFSRVRAAFLKRLEYRFTGQPNVRVHDGRLVLQSDLLFAPGSAKLDAAGKDQLRRFAANLATAVEEIPAAISWFIRVEGHTDDTPVAASDFRSNWEISIARAMAVVEFLVGQGISHLRLAAAGYGDARPLDDRGDEIANRRNRRIAFLLTQN